MNEDYSQTGETGNRAAKSLRRRTRLFVQRMFHRTMHHPSQLVRGSVAIGLIIGGLLGPFLPLLGVWMLPLGVALLLSRTPAYWRLRRRFAHWRRARRRLRMQRMP
jgi:hypothetical protein